MNQSKKTHVILVLVVGVLAGMMILAGCSDDDDPVLVIPEPAIGPESADELVRQFVSAYEAMDVDQYQVLLDPDFLMILQEVTTEEFPSVGTSLDYLDEERIHTRMFSGELLSDPNGLIVPGVQDIEFTRIRALGVWSPTDDVDRFPATEWAPFEVEILWDRGQSFWTSKVAGTVKIYARANEIEVGGTQKTYYTMAGMVDLTNLHKSSESSTWGGVKALFR